MKQPRKLLCICILSTLAGLAMAEQSNERIPANKLPDNEKRTILGATIADDGQFVIVTREVEEKGTAERYVIRFLSCGPSGVIEHMSVFSKDTVPTIAHDHPTTGKGRNIALAYDDLDRNIYVIQLKGKEIQKEKIILDDYGDIGTGWVLYSGNQRKLFVHKVVPWSRMIPHLEYAWIYCYRLDNGKPILETKASIEKGTMSTSTVKCVPAGDDVLIWQTFSKGNSDIKTLRVAKWNKSGKLKWNNLYTGEIFGFTIDPNDGSKATLWEGKETEEGRLRYVQYAVGPGITKPIPIDTSRSGVILRLLRVPARQTWVGATRKRNRVIVTVFDDNFAEQTVKTYSTNRPEDIALAEKDGKCHLIVLQRNEVIIKDIDTLPELAPKEN